MSERDKLADAKARFPEIVPVKPATRTPGTGKGIWMAPDFDEPLADFAEYM